MNEDPTRRQKRMTIEEIIAELDVDGDGLIDEDEWIAQLGGSIAEGVDRARRRSAHRQN